MSTIQYERIEHITERQHKLEKEYIAKLDSGAYDLKDPLVILNPYEICPLTALVMFDTITACEVTITVEGKTPEANYVHRFGANKRHILPIYGLYGDYENKVHIQLSNGESTTVVIKTEPLDEKVPVATKMETTKEYMDDNLIFLTAAMRAVPVGFDLNGDVRWYSNKNFAFDLKRVSNGHILVGTERLVKMPYFTTGIYEMAFSGKVFKEYRLEGGYHHDAIEMEDGNLLVLTFVPYSGTVEDTCVLLDRETGEVLKMWNYKKVLPQDVAGSGSQTEEDWFHNNSVWYDKRTNSLTFSGRHQDAVINLDYETGDLNWIIGDPEGWPEDMQKYFFTPEGEDFEWQYEQHSAVVLPDGDIMLFDNGHFRSKNPDNYIKNADNYSRGVRYRIDTDRMTIRQVWQYGKERGADFFSPYICNVEYYRDNHYMIHSGGIGYEDGVVAEGLAAMKAMDPKLKNEHTYSFNSITVELLDNEKKLELHADGNFYRAEKLPLYYKGEEIELGEGKLLGQLVETQTTKMRIRAEETGELIPEHYQAKLIEEADRITFNAIFEEGEMAQLLLENEAGDTRRYSITTIPQAFQAMCVGTFQKENPQNVDVFVNKAGLEGDYKVRLIASGKLYETGLTIHA